MRADSTRVSPPGRTSGITARCRASPADALEARIDELVRALGIAAIADRRAQGFSQGERMKVAIARALVHDPQTILLDEPTNGLDIMSIRALRGLLRELRASGKCLLFSSHVMQEVTALCDSIVILGHGRVVAIGHGRGTGRAVG